MRIFLAIGAALASLIIATAAWTGLIRASNPSIAVAWAHGLFLRKEAAAAELPNHRVILIGGSGAHYGFMGQEVTRLTGLPTVNFGTHAGLGMAYILYHAEQVLRPGDFAVLAIEPSLYFPDRPSKVLSEFVLHYDIRYLSHIPVHDALAILYGLSPTDMLEEYARLALPWTSPTGRAETVDEHGDETLVLSSLQTAAMRATIEATPAMPAWSVDPTSPPQVLMAFFDWARAHNVGFGLAWTPMLAKSEYSDKDHQSFFDNVGKWYTSNGGIALGSALSYFQPIENIFDYVLHDNEKGRIRASRILALALCKSIECPNDSILKSEVTTSISR